MESQEGLIPNAAAVHSSTPTHGMRKVVIRFLHGGTSYAHGKEMERSCSANAEKMNGKRVVDMDCKTEFQENIKKAKNQTDVASTSKALYNPTVTRYDETKKPTDALKKRKVHAENRKKLVMKFVNSEGKPACPICRKNCPSNKFLCQHMLLHVDEDWNTFYGSLNTHIVDKIDENHSHEPKVVDLSKYLFGWNVKTGKRSRMGSSVDADMKEAANILFFMACDHQLKSKTSMGIQREEEAANCLMYLDDRVTPPAVESGAQVEESDDTIGGEKERVCSFDLNEVPEFEDVSLRE